MGGGCGAQRSGEQASCGGLTQTALQIQFESRKLLEGKGVKDVKLSIAGAGIPRCANSRRRHSFSLKAGDLEDEWVKDMQPSVWGAGIPRCADSDGTATSV